MANEDRRRLFNAISEAGYDIGLYDEFDKRMNNAEDRKKFFQAVNEAGYDIGDQEEFERRISPSKYKLNIGGNEVPVSEREYMDFIKRNPSGVSKKPVSQPQQPTAEETINNANQTIYQGKQLGNRLAYNEQRAKRMGLSLPQGQYGRVDLGESRNLMEGDKRYNLESGELEPTYITEAGNEYENKAAANIEQQQIDAYNIQRRWENEHPEEALTGRIDSQIADLQQKRDALYKETVERIRQENEPQSGVGKFIHNIFTSDNPNAPGNRDVAMTAALNDPKVAALDVALRDLQDAKTMMQRNKELSKSSDFLGGVGIPFTKDWFNNWKNFGYGVWDAMDDIAFNFSGVNDVQKAGLYLDIKDKIDRGEELTDQETDLALAGMSLAQAEQLADLPTGYTAGQTTAEMAPFMLQMATNPASGMGKAFARKAVRKFGREGIEAVAARIAARAAGNLGEAAVLSNTFQAGKTLADISQRYAGSQFAKDEDGNIIMGHYEKGDNGEDIFVEGGDDLATAALKGEAASIIENFTELGAGGSINGMLSKAAASKLGQKIGLGYISNLVSKVGSTPFAKSMKRFMEATHWDGMIEEPLEEEYGIILNSLLTGDNQISDLWDAKQQADIFAGTMWFGGMMAAMNTAVYPFARRNIKRQLNNADVEGELAFGDEWPVMKASIEMMDDSKIPDFLYSIKDDDNFSNEQKAAMFGYASRLKQYQGANVGDMLMRMEGNLTPSEAAIKSAYDMGTDVELPEDRKQVVDEATQAEQQLSQYGEEFAKMIANSEDPFDTIDYLLDNREYYSDDQIAAAADYFQKQAMADGMMDAALDNVDLEVRRANNEVISNTHQETGKVINALHDGRPYYVVGGDVLIDPVTGDIQLQGTGGAMVVKDAETGETSVMSPAELSVNYAITAENLITANETGLRQQLMQQAEDDINFGAPANEVYQLEDTVTLTDGEGNVIEGQIGMMPNSIDGAYVVYTSDGKALQLTADDMNRRIVAHNGMEVQRESQPVVKDNLTTEQTEQPIEQNQPAVEQNQANSEQNQPETEQEEPQSALSRIPVKVDEKGNPFTNKKGKPILDWHKASVEDAAAALVETTGGNMLMARDTANDLYKQGQQKLEKIRKQQPKGDDPIEMAESRMEIQRQVEEQQAINKQWQDVNQLIQRQIREEQQRIEEERKAALTAEQRAAEEAEKARIEEQRRQIDEERRRKKMEEEMANWNKPYAPLAKARKEMAGDPDAAAILNDVEPRSLEEWVSSLLTPKSMMWDDEEIGGRTVAGLQSELGLQKKDVERVGSLVAPSSKGGKPFGQVVHDIWEGLPEGMKNMYNDQDVRNTLIDMFNNIGNALDMRHLAEINRIQEARDMMAENQRRYEEAELEAWAEAMHLTPEERETYNEWMEQAPTEPEAEIINNIIADEQYRIDQREGRQPASRADVSGSTSSQETVQQAAETADNGNNEERIAKEGQAAQSEQTAADNNVPGAESESVIPKPEVDEPRFKELRQNLVDAYTQLVTDEANYPDAAKKVSKAARQIQRYVDEGLDDYKEYEMGIEDYEGNDPEKLADQYITRVFQDRYADDDPDDLYIYHGLKPEMRKEFKFLEHNGKLFEANEHGICLNPNTIEMHKEKNNTLTGWEISTALSERGWVGAPSAHYSTGGWSSGVSASWWDEFFATEEECQAYWAQRILDYFKKTDAKNDKRMAKYIAGLQTIIDKVKKEQPVSAETETWEDGASYTAPSGKKFLYNKDGICTNPNPLQVGGTNFDVTMATAYNGVGWVGNVVVERSLNFASYKDINYSDTPVFHTEEECRANLAGKAIDELKESWEGKQETLLIKALRKMQRQRADETEEEEEPVAVSQVNVEGLFNDLNTKGKTKLSDHSTPVKPKAKKRQPKDADFSGLNVGVRFNTPNGVIEIARVDYDRLLVKDVNKDGNTSSQTREIDTVDLADGIKAGTITKVEPAAEQPKVEHKRLVSDNRMEELKKQLKTKLGGQLNVGVDPEVLSLGAQLAVGYLERGVTKFADFAKAMIDEVGDFMRPYLKSFYNAVRDMPEAADYAADMDDYQTVSAFDVHNFDKGGKVPDPITKAQQVTNEQKVKKDVKKIKAQQPDLFAGDLFADQMEPVAEPIGKTSSKAERKAEEAKVDTNPTEAQKEAGNYQKGHIWVDGHDITIENPKGSIRHGTDANGKEWKTKMNNTYGYIRGTEGVDGDHIDVYLSDNPASGNVYVIDQVNADGSFDESKCMYGFGSEEEARQAYLSNYSKGWKGLGTITEVSREDFKKWIDSSHRKTKPFADYQIEANPWILATRAEDGTLMRRAIDKDVDTNDVQYYYNGKPAHIMLVTRKGEQVSATKFSEPTVESVTLTDGKRVKLNDLWVKVEPIVELNKSYKDNHVKNGQVEFLNVRTNANTGEKQYIGRTWDLGSATRIEFAINEKDLQANLDNGLYVYEPKTEPKKPKLDKKDYKSYMTPEAREYFAKDPRFASWSHPELSFITAAIWDQVEIPGEVLQQLPEIVEAENKVKAARKGGKLTISDEERDKLANNLIESRPAKQEHKAIIVVGLPAGGKSSVFANPLSEKFGARIIDSDDVKPLLPGYDNGNGADYVQDASSEVAERAVDLSAKNGDNILLPRIGGDSVYDLALMLRIMGYDVQLYFNDVKGVTSIDRAASRFAETGRYLSLDYLTKKAGVPSEKFCKFAEKSIGDYLNERAKEKVQNIQERLVGILGAESLAGERLRELYADVRGREAETDRDLQGMVGAGGLQDASNELVVKATDPLFTYAEWKSNDVPRGEKPREIWNSNSNKTLSDVLNNDNNELHGVQSEQGLPGEPAEASEEAGQTGGAADRAGAERSPEQHRVKRSGHEHTIKNNNTRNNVGERGKDYAPTSTKARFNANVEAIKLMRQLIDNGVDVPTKEQMAVLRQYSGWGGMGTYFNDTNSQEYRELADLLSEEELNDARLSINSAYYTPASVIDTLWDIAKEMGFKGGNVLEGSAGIGNIIGQMPTDMSRSSNIEAVEIDAISGNILKLLYPDAKVHIKGFQDVIIPNGSVDLAITNVPFVTGLQVFDKVDKDLSRKFRNIHDFCIAKNIRKLREGGIGLFITSSGTLDKSTELRAWIADEGQADVMGAFRMNNDTFGGTTVTSDIIVVRKRTNGQKSPKAIDISTASPIRVGSYEDKYGDEHQTSMVVNDYFKIHPEMMAGEMAFAYEKGDTFRPGSYGLYPVKGMDQNKMLADFAKSMSSAKEIVAEPVEKKADPNQLTEVKEGRMLLDDNGRLCISRMGTAVPLQVNDQKIKGKYTKKECFEDYQSVQKAVDDVLQQQLNSPDDEALKPKLAALNKAYDNFVKKYGYLHKNTAIAFLRNDIDFPSFQALEQYNEKKDIKGNITVTTKKPPIFSERVLGFKSEPKPKNVKDAVTASIFRSNTIDLDWIAEKLDRDVDDVRKEILDSRLGFEDPSTGAIEIRYKYLSGNVREKLSIAEGYNTDGKYSANVEELRKAVPMDIPSHLIDFSLGSSWLPIELYNEFIKDTYDVPVTVKLIEGSWIMKENGYIRSEKNRAAGVYSEKFRETIYGHQLVNAALNNRPIRVSKQVKEGYGDHATTKTINDPAATQACAVRVDEIKEEFRQWMKQKMQSDVELSKRIEKIYNEKFNALVPMQIDDEFLPEHFEGSNVNITLRPHQKRGAIRDLTSPTMLAHEVGTGKSFTLITTAMEMRRLGTAKKPMLIVQNATVAQMTADAKLLYPNAKVLTLTEKDRNAEGRRAFYASIKYNDWDLIIIPQSTFERIPDSPERELQFIQEKIDEKKHVIEAAEAAGADSRQLRQLKNELEKIEQEYGDKFLDSDPANDGGSTKKRKKKDAKREATSLDKAKTKAKEQLDRAVDDVQYFDDLGVDALLVDEAHEYKHLGFQTSIGRGIKGIDPSYSKKCAGLYNKTRCVYEKAGWKNVVFATGTPISNTAAEIWTFMKYLMPADVMKQNDIYYFDDFVRNFGNISQMLEFTTSGKFKENTRFAAYVNRPELMRIWMQVADIVRSIDAKDVQDKLPKKEGGKDQDVFLPQSPSLINIMAAVRAELERFENMEGKEKKENSHIPLTMYGVAKRAAIDPRLVNPDAADEPLSKTNAAVAEIIKDLKATKAYNGTIAVFCDNQNRKGEGGVVEFNIYDDIKQKLIKGGVPEKQIAIIKSGMTIKAKQAVFDAVNNGDIRVVLGSTQTLGTGVNMQERLHLLIHMDAPDRPMDYTQRNGRIERQGNLHKDWDKPIRIVRFGVEDSLDVTAYQRLKTKSGFIDSIMNGKSALANNQVDRTVEEEEEGMFDNPVAVLSGSQYALLKNKAERELRKYQGKKSQWEADQIYITNALRQYNSINEDAEQKAQNEEKDLANIKSLFPDGKVKTISVEGTNIDMTKGDEAVGQLSKVIKEKINDPVNAIVKRNRENPFHDDETLRYKIKLDGHDVDFTIAVTRSNEWDNAANKMRTVIHKFTSYNSPDLRIKSDVSARSVKDLLDDILDEVVTGVDYQDRIDAIRAAIERRNSEMAQMKEREGKPFEYDKELEAARKQVDEYTELMKKEMEEKEAKYANQQAGDVDLTKAEDSEDDGNLYRMMDEYEEPIFYSNAMRAVEEIRQEKATPEQWLSMIQKNGGLKAGEDKWLGLSDWLNNIDKKSVTKQEIIDFIENNQIDIEEVHYADEKELMNNEMERRMPGWKEAFWIMPNFDEFEVDIRDEKKALDLFNANVDETDRHELEDDGKLSLDDFYDVRAWAEDMVSMTPFPKDLKRINETRNKYTTKGLENKREIALTVPTIEPYESGDKIHFGDAGGGRAIAWIRFGDAAAYADNGAKDTEFRRIMADNDQFYKSNPQFAKYGIGSDELKKESEERKQRQRAALAELDNIPLDKKVLVIDEIQSNRHQDGRDNGYSPSAKERNKLKEDWYDSAKKRDKYFEELTDKYNVGTLTALRGKATEEELNKYQQLMDIADEKLMKYETANKSNLVPAAPFEKNWHELAMKRMLRYAAENGYDKIAWTTGEQQAQRYTLGKLVNKIISYDYPEVNDSDGRKSKKIEIRMKDNETMTMRVDQNGKVIEGRSDTEGKQLSDIVGKDLARRIMSGEGTDGSIYDANKDLPAKIIEGEGLRIGAEGMKGFYDEILPRFLNKYGKKWNVKIEKTRLPKLGYTGETMWSIDITPEMRESVLQGQPMFRDMDEFAEGQLFPIRTTTANSSYNVLGQRNTYSTELLPDEYTSLNAMLDALRNQFPSYYVTIEDNNVKMQSWHTVLAEAKQAQTMKQTKGAESYVRRKTRQAIDAINDMAKRMHLDVEILTSTEELTDKQKRAKGWFNPKTHKIVIVLDNHTNRFDLINTLLHEGVAHYGLRLMFGENFDTFLDNVYNNVDESVKEKINAAMRKNGWSRHVATEEYLASLAERTDFENALNSGWWQKIKDFFFEMLAKAGFSTYLSDNDLRYILWRSYDNLLHPDSRRNIFDKAKEVQMQSQLRVGQYAERYQPTGLAAERKVSESVEKEYSTVEEASQIIRNLEKKYPPAVEVVVTNKKSSGEDLLKAMIGEKKFEYLSTLKNGELVKRFAEEIREIINKQNNGKMAGGYIGVLKKIIIFADKIPTDRLEYSYFHENIHAILDSWYGNSEDGEKAYPRLIAENFWNNTPDLVYGYTKEEIEKYYKPDVRKEEFFTYCVSAAMDSGYLDAVEEYIIDEGDKQRFNNLLNTLGYDREREARERRERPGEIEAGLIEDDGRSSRPVSKEADEIEDIISKAKADGTYMLAPNGKPTNLNEEQWAMVRTKAFKNWFGDWENNPENASKVVDENGEPKVMYHGTNLTENNGSVAFWKFRPDSHFGTDGQADSRLLVDTWLPALAESLSNKPRTLKRIKKYEVFLNIRNPKRVKDTPQEWIDENEGTFSEWWDKQNDRAKYQGYDGIVYLNEYEDREHPADSWITFKPNQVKSATDNNGEFSTENDDIRYRMVDAAQDIYNEKVAKKSLRFAEAWQDSMIGLKAIQDAIAAETGNVATGAEDAYHFENRMHGRAKNMTEQYDWRFYRPMLKAFSDFCNKHNLTQEQGIEYLVAKSGLERNVFYAFRNAMKQKVAEDISAEREKIEKDYAKGRIAEATYKQMKKDLEEKERTGVDDEMQKVKELLVYKRALEDYQKGDIDFTEYLRRIEKVINANTNGYYEEAARDFSGLTETFAKAQYDAAQEVKKEAQRAIDPREKRTLWSEYDAMMRDAYTAARQVAEDAVFGAESDISDTNKLWNAINAATKETLKTSYENGLIDRKGYDKVRDMFEFYIPLRGWDENKAADVYTYMGKDNVFSPAVKKTWGRTSKAENPLAYIGNIAVSTILSGHRNMLKQHFLNYVMNNPTNLVSISESWYENIGTEENPMWILRTADTAGKSADEIAQIVNDFNEEMQQKQAAGLAMPVKGRLRLDVNATKGQKSEHVVEVQRAGHTYQLYINGDPKAAQALNGTNSKAVSRISDTYLGRLVTQLNRSMAMFFTSKNPAFVVSNLSRDLNMAGASVAINEGAEYNARFIANAAKVLTPRLAAGDFSRDGIKAVIGKGKGVTGMMPKLMAKWKSGKLDTSNETERYFKEFMDEGGETGFVNMLSVDSFKEKMKNEIKQMNGSTLLGSNVKETSVGKGLRLLGETFEFYNRCAEDATRFIVYMTSRQMGKTLEESIADAKDVTLNFNRKGTGDKGNAEVRDLFIFVNPAIQALANMYRMSRQHPLKFGAVTTAFVAGGALMAILNNWALNLFGDDDDKEAYWNLPPWVRKNNLVLWVPGTKNFVTIPLAQEFRVFYGIGEMIASASLDHPVHNPGLELASSVADLIPINPTGNGGNLMVDFAPTMIQPLMQVGENVDFTGKPIWKDNQGNKFAPAYTKAYVSTPGYMVKVAEALNTITGGNEGKQGVVEQYSPIWGNYINNPAVWNHLLQGYFGGMYNTIAKGFDVIATIAQGEMPKVYQTPVINRFMNRPVERDNAGALGEEYYKLIEDRDRLKYELKTWKKKAADGEEGAQDHVDEILDSPEWKQVEVIDHYDKIMKDLRAGEKAATNSADKEDIKESIAMYKQQMNEELHAISEGKSPIDAAVEQFGQANTFAEKNKLRMRIERLTMENEGTEKNRVKSSNEEVSKALKYITDEERESRDVNERYLQIATPENIRDDARIKSAKAKIKRYTDEYKQMIADGRTDAAAKYRVKNQKWFAADKIVQSQSRAMQNNKKLLGNGYDKQIIKLIDTNRKSILKAIDNLD